jgi:NAD(P)-dependent dehydrogenase (short-subunit alcohol dehydrogenase family)
MAERYKNKAIIVTGAGNGMGRASALAFAREGGGVAVADINAVEGQAMVRQIADAGGQAIFVRCDVSRSADVQRLVAETVDAFGGVDVLHNRNASDTWPRVLWRPVARITPAELPFL